MQKYFFEIKNRVVLTVCFFISNFFLFFFYKEFLLFLIVKITCNNFASFSISDFNHYFTFSNVTDFFSIYFNLIVFLNVPFFFFFLLFQSFSFLGPAFFKIEYKNLLFLFKLSFFSFILSVIFSYFLIIPAAWDFFLNFQKSLTVNYQKIFFFEVKLQKYLNFCKNFFFYCFYYFQLLAAIIYLIFQISNFFYIKKFKKIFHCVFVLFSSILSVTDLFLSQLIGCLFLILFFEILFFFRILNYFISLNFQKNLTFV